MLSDVELFLSGGWEATPLLAGRLTIDATRERRASGTDEQG
jgi:hypothetical protein